MSSSIRRPDGTNLPPVSVFFCQPGDYTVRFQMTVNHHTTYGMFGGRMAGAGDCGFCGMTLGCTQPQHPQPPQRNPFMGEPFTTHRGVLERNSIWSSSDVDSEMGGSMRTNTSFPASSSTVFHSARLS